MPTKTRSKAKTSKPVAKAKKSAKAKPVAKPKLVGKPKLVAKTKPVAKASAKAKPPAKPSANEPVVLKKEALFSSIDDVVTTSVGDLVVVVRAKSSSSANQVVDIYDFSTSVEPIGSIKTKIPRDELSLFGAPPNQLLIGRSHGYSLCDLDLKTVKTFTLPPEQCLNDNSFQCGCFVLRGNEVLFAHQNTASLGHGLFHHVVGSANAVQKVASLRPKVAGAESGGKFSGGHGTLARVYGLFDVNQTVIAVTETGFDLYPAPSLGSLGSPHSIPCDAVSRWTAARSHPLGLVIALSNDTIALVDVARRELVTIFTGETVQLAVAGNDVIALGDDEQTLHQWRVTASGIEPLPELKVKLREESQRMEATSAHVIVMDQSGSGVVLPRSP